MGDEIVNKVAQSVLITFDLEDLYVQGVRTQIDLSQWLEQGFILREKEFRAARNAAKLEGSGSPLAQGPMFLAPTSNVVNNKSTYVMGRPITDTSFGGVISAR